MTNEIEFYVDGSAINNENPNVRTLGGIGIYKYTNSENNINFITARPDKGWAINVDNNAVVKFSLYLYNLEDYPLDLGKITNNTTELGAIYYALQMIKLNHKYDNCTIYGDSQYAGNLVFGSWKAKQNKELVAKVKALAKTVPNVTWEYVKAHDGNVYNEYADYLAKTGAYNRPPLPFEEWKENYPRVGIDVKEQDNQIKVSDIANFSSVTFEFLDDRTINNGDIIISLNGKKIKTLKDWDQGYSTLIPNKLARFVIQPKDSSKKIKTNIKIINFNKFLELNRKFCMSYWPKEGAKILLKEYEEYNFYLDEKYKSKVLAKFWNKKNTDTIIKKVIKKLKK